MREIVVIRNPTSGRGKFASCWPSLERRISQIFDEAVCFIDTEYSGHARELSEVAARNGAQIVIAAGGDGTINQVANGVMGTDATLGLLPCGTGNDLCRTLGIAKLENALEALKDRHVLMIDVAKWTTDHSSGIFLNVAGMGFDAVVAQRINQGFRHLRGTSAYIAAMLTTLRSYRAQSIQIEIDEFRDEQEIMLCAVANAQSYGGGMRIAPMASITDGLLDVVIVGKLRSIPFLTAFPRVFKGTHLDHAAVSTFRGSKIRLIPRSESSFLVDGELHPCSWVEIEVATKSLSTIVGPRDL